MYTYIYIYVYIYIYTNIYKYVQIYTWFRPPSLPPMGGGGAWATTRGRSHMGAVYGSMQRDEDIGMNIQGHYQPQGGRGKISYRGIYI